MAVGLPLKTTYANGDVYSASDVNDTNGTINTTAAPYAAGKNKIINGDFFVNQRNFSSQVISTSTPVYGADRFKCAADGAGTVTYSIQQFTAGTAPVAGYEAKQCTRIVTTGQTVAGTYTILAQHIENVRTFAGQTATISFYAKAASGTPKMAVEIEQNFGSGGSPSVNVRTYLGQVTLSTSWARYTVSATIPSISGKTVGTDANTSNLAINLWVSAGSTYNANTGSIGIQSNTFDVWGVQVEAGSVATAFQTATGTIQGELAACQRYYSKSYNIETSPATSSTVGAVAMKTAYTSSYQNMPPVYFKTTMRVSPTITLYSTGGTSGKIRSGAGGGTDVNGASQYIGSNGFVAYVDNVSITSDIELRFQYVAEAEL